MEFLERLPQLFASFRAPRSVEQHLGRLPRLALGGEQMVKQCAVRLIERRGELEFKLGEGLELSYEALIKFSRLLTASAT